MSYPSVSRLLTKIYIDFLRALALEDPSLQAVMNDITLASLLVGEPNNYTNDGTLSILFEGVDFLGQQCDIFKGSELAIYGPSTYYHQNSSSRQQVLKEVQSTLHALVDVFCERCSTPLDGLTNSKITYSQLPEALLVFKHEIESLREEAKAIGHRLTKMTVRIQEKHDRMDQKLKAAITTTFPSSNDARSAGTDLLAAFIENHLIKLSLTKARSERSIYHHQPTWGSINVAQALSIAYSELRKEEVGLQKEYNILDRQLQEYDAILRLVDGSSLGYQQIVDDWLKIKQETEECLRDLRRLGWTGD